MNAKYVKLCNDKWLPMIFIHCDNKAVKDRRPRRADEWNWKCSATGEDCQQEGCPKLAEINKRWADQEVGDCHA